MKIGRLVTISRPHFWIYEVGPYIIGVAAALYGSGTLFGAVVVPIAIFFLFFLYPANLYIYGINDIFDYETDKLNPKKVSYESLVMPSEHKNLFLKIFLTCAPFLLYGLLISRTSGSYQYIIGLLSFFFFAGFYSAPPIRAKAKPFLDSIFSAGHYIATAVFSYLLVINLGGGEVTLGSLWLPVLAGMSWGIAMHAYSAVPDIQADKGANLSTIATLLGKRVTIVLCSILYALSAIIAFSYIGYASLLLGIVYILFMFASLKTSEEELFMIYKYFPYINSLSGMIVFFSIFYNLG